MDKLISLQRAIEEVHKNYDTILDFTSDGKTISSSIEDILSELPSAEPESISRWKNEFKEYVDSLDIARDDWKGIIEYIDEVPSVQPEHCGDAVSRNAIVQKLNEMDRYVSTELRLCDTDKKFPQNEVFIVDDVYKEIVERLPSVQPTLYGYNIEHLELIARVLQKEDLPPERVAEVLINIGEIVAIVRDEFEETLRKAVEDATNRCG